MCHKTETPEACCMQCTLGPRHVTWGICQIRGVRRLVTERMWHGQAGWLGLAGGVAGIGFRAFHPTSPRGLIFRVVGWVELRGKSEKHTPWDEFKWCAMSCSSAEDMKLKMWSAFLPWGRLCQRGNSPWGQELHSAWQQYESVGEPNKRLG